jgi:Sigma-54 interaction domain
MPCFYVSWVDLRTDPWPLWEKYHADSGEKELEGRPLHFDHPDWPGMPCVEGDEPIAVSHPKLGRLVLPGISVEHRGRKNRLYTGPTLSALFHPGSRYTNLRDLDKVFLLFQPERPDSPHKKLKAVIEDLCACPVRKIDPPGERLKFVSLKGITDPTGHEEIVRAIKAWLAHDKPFRWPGQAATRVVVNLSPGTPAMHAAWLMLRWNGALGGAETVVEFVQGDGGLAARPATGDALRTVPIDVLSEFIGRSQVIAPVALGSYVDLRKLGPPFDDLRQRIEHAALLGLPILLYGERGTGKTFLAQYYHERRLAYRRQQSRLADQLRVLLARKPAKVGDTWPIDSQALAQLFAENGELDLDKSRANARLIKIFDRKSKQYGQIEVAFDLVFKSMSMMSFKFKPPGALTTTGLVDVLIDDSPDRVKSSDDDLGPGLRFPDRSLPEHALVTVTLSEFADLDTLRDTLFGWVEGAFTGAKEAFDGLLGEAHGGTLFLDEIHHLERPLQAALLGPLNNRHYRPKMARKEVVSHFDLVVATNDAQWREKLADDFRDRIERIVLDVPSFETLRKLDANLLWKFWDFTLRRRCDACGITYQEEGPGWEACHEQLRALFQHRPLRGNWRDLQRLADNLLLHLTYPRDGQPSPIGWDKEKLNAAIGETFAGQ